MEAATSTRSPREESVPEDEYDTRTSFAPIYIFILINTDQGDTLLGETGRTFMRRSPPLNLIRDPFRTLNKVFG